jgi:hypothetical protein
MKNFNRQLAIISMLILSANLNAQIGIGTTSPAASAQLDVTSTTKGVLIPRLALGSITSASPVTSPTTSLLVYNTATAGTFPNNVTPGYYYWNGTTWQRLEDQTNNPGEFHWNYVEGNPTTGGLGATLVGNASWQTSHVRLTSAGGSLTGNVYWVKDIDWTAPLYFSVQTWAGGGTGADGIWLFFGATSSAVGSTALHSTAASGISVFLDEIGDQVSVYKNGTLVKSLSTVTNLDNSQWQVHEFFFGKNADGTRFLDVKTNNGEYLGTVDVGSFTAGGDYVGVGGWTGASTNEHRVRRLLIQSAVHKPR